MTPREKHLADICASAHRHGLTRDDLLKGRSRCHRVKTARRDAVSAMQQKGMGWSQIGRLFDRHHTTIMAWADYA